MNRYYYIEPEVAGGLGKETQLDHRVHPPIVKFLEYEFDGWLGDDILESFPCFIVTNRLKERIESEKLTGVFFNDVIVSKSQEFLDFFPHTELPDFFWLEVKGEYCKDDFFIGKDYRLVVSEAAYKIIMFFKAENALFENFEMCI